MKSVAELEKEITKRLKAKKDQAAEKMPEEIEKEILENREALEAIEAKEAKESVAKSDLIEHETKPMKESELEVHKVKPVIPSLMDCPFCGEEKSARGMPRHIKSIHGVPGISIQDLDDVEKALKSLEDLVIEKFPEGEAEIFNLSPEVEKKDFPDWMDIEPEEGPAEDLEDLKDPEEKAEENGGIGLLPILLIIGIPAVLILSRIPQFKEIADRLATSLAGLGSKEVPDSKSSFNYGGFSGLGPFNRF